jgi:hypothetical protein
VKKEMKSTILLTVSSILLVSMLASIGMAAANETYYPIPQIQAKGVIWVIPTDSDYDGTPDFNGNLLIKNSVVATVFVDTNGDELIDATVVVHPLLILTFRSYILLVFCPNSLPVGTAVKTLVTGNLQGGDSIVATGPGFTYRIK